MTHFCNSFIIYSLFLALASANAIAGNVTSCFSDGDSPTPITSSKYGQRNHTSGRHGNITSTVMGEPTETHIRGPYQYSLEPLPSPTHFVTARKPTPGAVQNACFPTSTSPCCYDPMATSQPACLWSDANVTEYIENYFNTNPVSAGGNWVRVLLKLYGVDADCDLGDCSYSLLNPVADDSDSIRQFLALVAVRRWMQYQGAQYTVMYTSLNNFISQDIPNIISDFGSGKTATDEWGLIADGLAIAGAALSIITAPITAGGSLAIGTLIAGGLGVLGGVGDLIDTLTPGATPRNWRFLQTYFQNCAHAWASFIEDTVGNFTSNNATYAFSVLNANDGSIYLNTTDEPLWKQPSNVMFEAQHFYRAWAIDKVLQGLGVFIHMDKPGCDGRSTSNKYPGQSCTTYSDSNIDLANVYAFPVLYQYAPYTELHTIREFPEANNLASWNLTWGEVAVGAYSCQYHYAAPFKTFGKSMYPNITDVNGLWSDINTYGTAMWATTGYCLWNTPVTNAADSNILQPCVSAQRCCTGYGGHDHLILPQYNDDNFALDDWAAGQLGINDTFTNDDSVNWGSQC